MNPHHYLLDRVLPCPSCVFYLDIGKLTTLSCSCLSTKYIMLPDNIFPDYFIMYSTCIVYVSPVCTNVLR